MHHQSSYKSLELSKLPGYLAVSVAAIVAVVAALLVVVFPAAIVVVAAETEMVGSHRLSLR
jgi:hypothetical protein